MKTWLLNRWDALRGTFWFVPMVMVAGAVGLSILTLGLDNLAADSRWELLLPWTFTRGPEGRLALLATVAGSMITIASVSFSITVVALQQASSQFGPRLLYNFVRDRGNQMVLGTFIATFTYCLLILRSVNGTDKQRFVPHLSVTTGLLLALASVGVLIFFIHHTASSMQAENVIAEVSRDLHSAIDRLFPAGIGREPSKANEAKGEIDLPSAFADEARSLEAPTSDYLQNIDLEGLMSLATEHDLVLKVIYRPGQFVIRGHPLVLAAPPARISEEIASELRGAFYFGIRRTLTQDVEFAIDQIVEVAVRALTGIDDPFTAMTCIDRLGAALSKLMEREIPSAHRHDDKGRLRVVTDVVTMGGIADAMFHQIRQAARSNAAVTLRLLEIIAVVAPGRGVKCRDALLRHATLIYQGSREGIPAESDRAEVHQRFQSVLQALGPPRL